MNFLLISRALASNPQYKGIAYAIGGDTYDSIVWPPDAHTPMPTQDDLQTAIDALPPPTSVTQRQARLALAQVGLLDQVNAAVAKADQPTQLSWQFASDIPRNSPLVATIGTQLNLDSSALDKLFKLASTL